MEAAKSIVPKSNWYWLSDLQYSTRYNTFVMLTMWNNKMHFVGDGWDTDTSETKINIYTSNRPFGPFEFKKTLAETYYSDALTFVDFCSIIAIYQDKIVGQMATWKPDQDGDYNTEQAGYGNYLWAASINE